MAQLGYWHWLRLGVSAMLDNVVFNASEIYGWTVTDISPNTLWARVAVIAFNLYLELLAISTVIRFLEVSRSARRRLPRRQYSTYLAFMVPRIGSTLVTLFWALPIFVALVAVWHDGFDLGFTWSFLSTTVLFFAGVWLVTTHLWALSVRGILNHLAALTGVVAGAALVALVAQPYLIFLQR